MTYLPTQQEINQKVKKQKRMRGIARAAFYASAALIVATPFLITNIFTALASVAIGFGAHIIADKIEKEISEEIAHTARQPVHKGLPQTRSKIIIKRPLDKRSGRFLRALQHGRPTFH